MARIRTIKPEFWRHEGLSALPEATVLLAAALLNYADDEGYFNANPALIKADCCPLREPSVSIHESLTELSNISYLRLGDGADGRRYGHVLNFTTHQKINRPTSSKIKALDVVWEGSPTTHAQLTEPSLPERNREQGRERNREQGVSHSPPDDWLPSEVSVKNLRGRRPDLDLDLELERFRLHEFTSPKSNWDSAFMSWCIGAKKQPARNGRAQAEWAKVVSLAGNSREAKSDDPITEAVVTQMGGWMALGRLDQRTLSFKASEFAQLYAEAQ